MSGPPHDPNGSFGNGTFPSRPDVIVRAEEALIVALILALWIAAIALFFNRWGKIRMLEPYQPKFVQQRGAGRPAAEQIQHRSFSKFNISGVPAGDVFLTDRKLLRPRQNSVFVGCSSPPMPSTNVPRQVKSAFDLQNLASSYPSLDEMPAGIERHRRPSLLPVSGPRPGEHRRSSFKDLVEAAAAAAARRRSELSVVDVDPTKKNKLNNKIGESKRRSTLSDRSSSSDGRHPPKSSRRTRRDGGRSSFSVQKELSPPSYSRDQIKGGIEGLRRNSMLFVDSSFGNFLDPRDNVKSGVVDFRRNSMLIINNLTEDVVGLRSFGNFSLGGSNAALGTDISATARRNSVIPPCESAKQKPNVLRSSAVKTKAAPSAGDRGKQASDRKSSESTGAAAVAVAAASTIDESGRRFLSPTAPRNLSESSAALDSFAPKIAEPIRRGRRRSEEEETVGADDGTDVCSDENDDRVRITLV